MDADSWPLLLAFVIFVILGAYFAGAESAFSAMNTLRIKSMAADGDKRARRAMYINDNFDRALTTLLIGNNITHIAASAVATVVVLRVWKDVDNITVWCTFITTAAVFLFSEMIPKSYANDRSETMSLRSAGFLRTLMKLMYYPAKFFMLITSFITRMFSAKEQPSVTEEELHDIIDTAEEEGVFDEDESDLFKSALDFSSTTVKDIMTVRSDIVALDANAPSAEVVELIKRNTHSRIPVFDGSLDKIIGTLLVRNYVKSYLKDKTASVRDMLNEPCFTSPDTPIDDLLSHMRQRRIYLAVVSDREGRTLGLVTIEDFLEELVGEIWDEDDVFDKDFVKLGGNRFQLSPKLRVSDAFAKIGYKPRETKPFMQKPLISWVVETLKHIPREEESFIYDRLEVTVDEVEDNKVVSVVVRLLDDNGSK